MTPEAVLGVVLAGGLSRRMGGQEKSLLSLNGAPLVKHVADRLASQVERVLINANGDPARFDFLQHPVSGDTIEGYAGPLAGVLAGMRWAQKNTMFGYVLTAAADTPFFPETYASTMIGAVKREEAQIALAASNERHHPVFGLWPVMLADALEDFLVNENNRKVMFFVERYSHCRVNFENTFADPFFNVNTPDDMQRAETISKGANVQ